MVPKMPVHFEDLWNQCEELQAELAKQETVPDIIDELMLKINLYKALDHKEIPAEERQQANMRTMGEILLTLSKLSLKDNVNVYEALSIALQYRSIDHYAKKYVP